MRFILKTFWWAYLVLKKYFVLLSMLKRIVAIFVETLIIFIKILDKYTVKVLSLLIIQCIFDE